MAKTPKMNYEDYEKGVLSLTDNTPYCGKHLLPFMFAVSLEEPLWRVWLRKNEGPNDALCIEMESGVLQVWDDGQSCCERRYATTDDQLDTFAGAKLVGIDIVEMPTEDDKFGEPHEQTFVKIETTAGTITLVTHNEHNGYYGGFHVVTSWEDRRG